MKVEKGNKMITREFLRSLNFRPFKDSDYLGFAGVGSPVPLIAETEKFIVVIDGAFCEVFGETENGDFDQIDFCENIIALGY